MTSPDAQQSAAMHAHLEQVAEHGALGAALLQLGQALDEIARLKDGRALAAALPELATLERVRALDREWGLTEFPDERTADLMRSDLRTILALGDPS